MKRGGLLLGEIGGRSKKGQLTGGVTKGLCAQPDGSTD